MIKLLIILCVALVFEAVGVVYLSKGLKQVGEPKSISINEIKGVIIRGATNSNLLLGIFFEALFFGGLLTLMSRGDVSFVWPLTSLGFLLTTLAARFILHEQVPPLRWAGVFLIVAGAALITYSEKAKSKPTDPGANPAAAVQQL